MLYGRHEERAIIARLRADGFQVLRGTGVESEVELPFAVLHQLLRPVLDRLDRLPAPQADGLLAGKGLSNREIADRLFLSRHTVGYHLHKVDAKLEIASRANLRRVR